MYQKDITQAIMPSMPSGQGQATAARGTALMAQAVAGAVKEGVSIFEDVQQQQFASKQADLVEEFETAGQVLKAEGESIKRMDFLDAGPPEESAVVAFKERQKAYLEAAKQFPNKFKEMKQRSGALLKEYISKYPGLADQFRKSSADLTGIGRLDLDNIRELYNDVEWLQKKQSEEAAASAAQLAEFKKAFVDTAVAEGRVDRLTALRQAEVLTLDEMNRFTERVTKARNAKSDFEEGLKRGDMVAGNIVAATKAEWTGAEASLTGPLYLLMKSKGIMPGAVTPEAMQDPEVKKALSETFATVTSMRREYFLKRMKELQAHVGGANSKNINEAISELQAWYASEEKKWNANNFFMNPLSFAKEGVDQDTFGKRMTNIERLMSITGVNTDQPLRDVLMNFDPSSAEFQKAMEARPHLAPVLPLLRQMIQQASYADTEAFDALTARTTQAMFAQPTLPATPKTKEERAAVGLATEALRFKMGELIRGTLPETEDKAAVVNGYLQNILLTGNGAAVGAREVANIKAAIEKLPEQQRAATMQLFSQKVSQSIFGVNSDADIAKSQYESLKNNQAYKGAKVEFLDQSGLTPLNIMVQLPAANGLGATRGNVAPDVLRAIDNKLILEAELTGKPLAELRKNFIKVFNAEGVPSSTVVRMLSQGGTSSTGVSLGDKPMGSVRTEAQMRKEVADLPPVPEAELQEASRVLREALKRNDLSPAARKEIEATLKGN